MITTSSHSAADGFHDIKPLPEFHPVSPWWVYGPLLAALVLTSSWWLGRRPARSVPQPVKAPIDRARERLRELELARSRSEISSRDFASELSLAYRNFLEQRLGFPAVEQTVSEIAAGLPARLKRALPMVAEPQSAATCNETKSVLRFLERAAFADDATVRYPLESQAVGDAFNQIRQLVELLDRHLAEESSRFETPGPKLAPAGGAT